MVRHDCTQQARYALNSGVGRCTSRCRCEQLLCIGYSRHSRLSSLESIENRPVQSTTGRRLARESPEI
eukprot:1292901-Prymnesium_polylepis.1